MNRWTLGEVDFFRGEVLSGTVVATRQMSVFVSVKPGVIGMAPYKSGNEFVHGDRLEFQVNSFDAEKRKLHLIEWDAQKAGKRKREKYRAKARRKAARQSHTAEGNDNIITGVFADKAVVVEEGE
ncbi:hypothetical protein N752_29775 [Desulforamulus aquiferis]|nr:hypothetical protein [Desulforamulus aquiferis]RYD01494.1 hypothetical protein N752_29775 [Desulforamulus aquiferis]